ncbi:MAG: response regulator [Deltaproteobacteria bacterium]|nr:response regulator [Deltaproteobacteria bacterium]
MGSKHILVIDDDRDFALSAMTFLAGRGFTVETAGNGTEAWVKIQETRPDLIVLDIMMDYDAEGFNLAYKLKEDEVRRQIPILIVSGFSQHLAKKMDQFQFVLGQDWPADGYLEKPVNLKELAAAIERFLPLTGDRKPAVQAN